MTFSLLCPDAYMYATQLLEEEPESPTRPTCDYDDLCAFWGYAHDLIEMGVLADLPYTADEARGAIRVYLDTLPTVIRRVPNDDAADEIARLEIVLPSRHELYIYGIEGGESVVRNADGDEADDFDFDWSAVGAYYWRSIVESDDGVALAWEGR